MAPLPLKASHKEQHSVIFSSEQKGLGANAIQYTVTSALQDQQYMFGVKNVLMVGKVLLTRNDLVHVAVLF